MKNYTSEVPVDRTITKIEQLLARVGARNIIKAYKDGELEALSFTLFHPPSRKTLMIRMPANIEAVKKVFLAPLKKKPTRETLERIGRQAPRTAWRLQQDWLEVQFSLIELEQVEPLQVFLPYVLYDGRKTVYAAFQEVGFKMLPEGRKED